MIDAIAWDFRTGSQRTHLSAAYGSWKGVRTRLRNRAIDGTRERVLTAPLARADVEGDPVRVVPVDSTVVRAHRNAAVDRHRERPRPRGGTGAPPSRAAPPPCVGRAWTPPRPAARRGCAVRRTGAAHRGWRPWAWCCGTAAGRRRPRDGCAPRPTRGRRRPCTPSPTWSRARDGRPRPSSGTGGPPTWGIRRS
ncbi:hypothetical protein EAO76_10745 [Streptomyces sp. sk2.1]|nr:hypothetical protein EAO76_10745 [Streptomyces sp. sk2.1]